MLLYEGFIVKNFTIRAELSPGKIFIQEKSHLKNLFEKYITQSRNIA